MKSIWPWKRIAILEKQVHQMWLDSLTNHLGVCVKCGHAVRVGHISTHVLTIRCFGSEGKLLYGGSCAPPYDIAEFTIGGTWQGWKKSDNGLEAVGAIPCPPGWEEAAKRAITWQQYILTKDTS